MPDGFAIGAVAAAILVVPGAAVAQAGAWQPPVLGPVTVVRSFTRPLGPYGAGHRGVDLAAAPGAVVVAAGAGTVAFAGPVGGRGVVVVRHMAATATEYEPVAPLVPVGARVAAGTPIGIVQPPTGHCGSTSCLHWGLRRAGRYEDPMSLLRPRAPVLLPFLDRAIPGPGSGEAPRAAGPGTRNRQPRAAPGGRMRRLVVAGGTVGGAGVAGVAAPVVGRVLRRVRPAVR